MPAYGWGAHHRPGVERLSTRGGPVTWFEAHPHARVHDYDPSRGYQRDGGPGWHDQRATGGVGGVVTEGTVKDLAKGEGGVQRGLTLPPLLLRETVVCHNVEQSEPEVPTITARPQAWAPIRMGEGNARTLPLLHGPVPTRFLEPGWTHLVSTRRTLLR